MLLPKQKEINMFDYEDNIHLNSEEFKSITSVDLSKDEFEDILYNPSLIVVQKETTSDGFHLTSVYVYDSAESKKASYAAYREITADGVCYYKVQY